jgi:hypothetical protein
MSRKPPLPFVVPALVGLAVWCAPALGNAQIKRPGAHPDYSVELEPHFVIDWNDHDGPNDDESLGLGVRATIPFLENGPIDTINNNMGIGFGFDYTFSDDACDYRFGGRRRDWDCEVSHLHFPVVVQWNFWLTPIISVFGEAGFEIVHTEWEIDNAACIDCEGDDTDLEPVFWGGGRFLFGEGSTVGAVVRIGWPYFSAGVGILL